MYKNFKKVSFWAENKLGIIAMDNGNSNVMDAEMLSEMLGALSIAVCKRVSLRTGWCYLPVFIV